MWPWRLGAYCCGVDLGEDITGAGKLFVPLFAFSVFEKSSRSMQQQENVCLDHGKYPVVPGLTGRYLLVPIPLRVKAACTV